MKATGTLCLLTKGALVGTAHCCADTTISLIALQLRILYTKRTTLTVHTPNGPAVAFLMERRATVAYGIVTTTTTMHKDHCDSCAGDRVGTPARGTIGEIQWVVYVAH